MLVISRKCDEAIVIGDGIEIRVLRVGQDRVRIGISAPADVPVHRREVYEEVCQANKSAASSAEHAAKLAERLRGAIPAVSGPVASGPVASGSVASGSVASGFSRTVPP